jgi:hypothetical protein
MRCRDDATRCQSVIELKSQCFFPQLKGLSSEARAVSSLLLLYIVNVLSKN